MGLPLDPATRAEERSAFAPQPLSRSDSPPPRPPPLGVPLSTWPSLGCTSTQPSPWNAIWMVSPEPRPVNVFRLVSVFTLVRTPLDQVMAACGSQNVGAP